MSDTRPLWIWVNELDSIDLDAVKRAKAELDVEFKIFPVEMASGPHDWGSGYPLIDDRWDGDRVLAIGTKPPWVGVDYFLVAEHASSSDWLNALSWVLGVTEEDWEATTVIDTLTAICGKPVRQVTEEELAGEKRFSDYVNGVV